MLEVRVMNDILGQARRVAEHDTLVAGLLSIVEARSNRLAGMSVGEARFFPGISQQSASNGARIYGLQTGQGFTTRKIVKHGKTGILVTRRS